MSLPSDLDCARAAHAVYGRPDAFFRYDGGADRDGVAWGLQHRRGCLILAFRGTHTLRDFLRDARALAHTPLDHPDLGPVHPGFWAGVEDAWREIRPQLTEPWVVTGHSLGAAHATLVTALAWRDGKPPLRRVAFGEPKSGFPRLARLVNHVPSVSYYNRLSSWPFLHDPVCDVPAWLPDEPYLHATPLTRVRHVPTLAEVRALGVFACHAMSGYVATLERGA